MSIALPNWPGPADASPAYMDWGGVLRPIFGGSLQKLRRLGDRFALDVTTPPLESAEDGRIWIARLISAQRAGAIYDWPQLGFDVGPAGAAVVDGGGQAGSILNLRGLTPGYLIREGQFFSLIHGGRRYLHLAGADVLVDSGGKVTLPIAPMLRVHPADGAPCDFIAPKIEGLLTGDTRAWTINVARTIGLSFQIQEAR